MPEVRYTVGFFRMNEIYGTKVCLYILDKLLKLNKTKKTTNQPW